MFVCVCVCVCAVRQNLEDAGPVGHVLQHAGLVAVLEEDGSVVVHVQHLHEHGGRARPPAARWAVVWGRDQYVRIISVHPRMTADPRSTADAMERSEANRLHVTVEKEGALGLSP